MAYSKRTIQPRPEMDDCEHLSTLGDDPEAWDDLDDADLKQVIAVKFIEYGATQDGSRIPGLFALYRHAMERLSVDVRREMLVEFSGMIEQHGGLGHMGLMMFLAADTNPGIRSSAALSLAVLFDPSQEQQDELAGPRFVIRTLVHHDNGAPGQGAALGGVLLLGNRRINPLLAEVWDGLTEEAQLEMTAAKSGFVTEAMVEFWLDRLEDGCSEAVFGSAVAAIAKMPVIAQVPIVLDVERLLPAYAGGKPMKLLRRTSFADYLEVIRPRLEALEAAESEPKVIPRIFEMWKSPDAFRGLVG
ncbi:MAG: hypothetical protein ACO3JG_16155 [Luteolibacter sp.]